MIRNLSLVFILTLLLSACASAPLTMNQLQSMQRGQSMAQVNEMISRKPVEEVPVRYGKRDYLVQYHKMQTGTVQRTRTVCNPPPNNFCYPQTYTVPVTAPYVFMFRSGKLLTWGFVDDLKKDSDRRVVRVMGMSAKALAKK